MDYKKTLSAAHVTSDILLNSITLTYGIKAVIDKAQKNYPGYISAKLYSQKTGRGSDLVRLEEMLSALDFL